ncbi:hypothetical protein AB0D34_21475 [Streptomyces sp. NPDC048420]|uniref:hypothetical protein n=1 Tax=Streptomyces sp. NPDC048420 TaxID=3155755 RepID=UPI0034441886
MSRHPLWGAVEFTPAWHVVLVLLAKVVLPPLAPSWFPGLGATVVNAVCCAAVWVVLWRWGWLRASGVAVLGRLRCWWLALPMFLVACSYAVAGMEGRTTVLVSGLVTPLGAMRAAIGVGFLFGVGLFGFTCAGLRYAIGSVWPMVAVHGLDDFSTSSTPGSVCGCCATTAPVTPM